MKDWEDVGEELGFMLSGSILREETVRVTLDIFSLLTYSSKKCSF